MSRLFHDRGEILGPEKSLPATQSQARPSALAERRGMDGRNGKFGTVAAVARKARLARILPFGQSGIPGEPSVEAAGRDILGIEVDARKAGVRLHLPQ
jgi:hypothetical protein